MDEFKEMALKEKAPKFMRDLYEDPAVTAMAWGCECGDGWYSILEKLIVAVEEINNQLPNEKFFYATQIKEKYGELRVYWEETEAMPRELMEKVSALVEQAETESWNTCEVCGAPATKTTQGWVRRLCDKCYGKQQQGEQQ